MNLQNGKYLSCKKNYINILYYIIYTFYDDLLMSFWNLLKYKCKFVHT